MRGRGACIWACMAGGVHGRGGMHGMGSVHGRGGCVWHARPPPNKILRDTAIRSMSGRYASYWNAFLFIIHFTSKCMSPTF